MKKYEVHAIDIVHFTFYGCVSLTLLGATIELVVQFGNSDNSAGVDLNGPDVVNVNELLGGQ